MRTHSQTVPSEPPTRTRRLPVVDDAGASRLAAELARHVRGEVRFDRGSRALYATAASNYRQIPIGVVVPRDEHDVIIALEIARAFDAPVLNRGGGTSLAGQTCNVALVIDHSKYLRGILELDPEQRSAWVQPGVVLDDLRERAEEFHLTFGPDPATHNRCTLGGMIGNNSCGVHSVMAGCTAENVLELDVMTYDGARFTVGPTSQRHMAAIARGGGRRAEIHERLRALRDRYATAIRQGFPDIPRRVSGYDLPALLPENGFDVARALVGSEGTLATVLSAKLRLVPSPRARVLLVLGYPDVFHAADHVREVMDAGPIALEGLDDVLVRAMKKKRLHPEGVQLLPDGCGFLLAEFGGDTPQQARDRACAAMAALSRARDAPTMKLFDDPHEARILWTVREAGLGATARVPGEPDTWEGWEDASVPPERLGSYLRAFRALLQEHGYRAALYGHFGQGCVHTRIPFDLRTGPGIARFRAFVERAADLVVAHGGSLSGEHGDGQARAELLPRMFGPELMRALSEFKAIWDPDDRMNPGKIVRPYALDENLRLGAEYRAPALLTHFRFPQDDGSFARATERCVGVGECRRTDGGTMCPSYMVTLEERHSTRGRAHLLFETMRGGLPEGMDSEAVREALDLCLSCKGCKRDCPVNVDVATYKAEFLSHYYERHARPRSAYAFGLIRYWARLGALSPGLANAVMRSPLGGRALKALAGIEPRRSLPELAPVTFRSRWRARPRRNLDRPPVLLWVDTFSNHFEPAVPMAAVEVLEHAGFRVVVPASALCCGRPLYDHGMLDTAKSWLREIMAELAPALRRGMPIVGLEPSCIAVFRDELPGLFPDDPLARALCRNARMLDEFLAGLPDWQPPELARRAIVQGHCHHRSIMTLDGELAVLHRMGADARLLDAGCCGMAGGFGYEKEHYPVSIACGERKLLPAVRQAADDTLVIADGFSCRQQIGQGTARTALHLAQVLQMAMLEDKAALAPGHAEREGGRSAATRSRSRNLVTGLLAAAGVIALAAVVRRVRARSAQPGVAAPDGGRTCGGEREATMRCEEIMKTDVECVAPTDSIETVAAKMRDQNVGFVPVCDDERKVLGAITDRDIAIRLVAEGKPASTEAETIMTTDCVACSPDDDLERAEELMAQHQKSRIMCTDEDGRLVGVISLSDVAQHEDGDRASRTLRQVSEREAKPTQAQPAM